MKGPDVPEPDSGVVSYSSLQVRRLLEDPSCWYESAPLPHTPHEQSVCRRGQIDARDGMNRRAQVFCAATGSRLKISPKWPLITTNTLSLDF